MLSCEHRWKWVPSVALAVLLFAGRAAGQVPAQGFALERYCPSAPSAGWFVLDTLDMHGALGGAAGATLGYARNPLRVGSGPQQLGVVSSQAFMDFGFAATYDRMRAYVNFDMPLVVHGTSGNSGAYVFSAPRVDPGSTPDALSDPRLGFDLRLVGASDAVFRVGLGAQVYFPSGTRADYDTDHTYRAMGRLLSAGDVGAFSYASELGVHLRPLTEASPEGPRGSELLFGFAAGGKLRTCARCEQILVIGPELFGASAFRSMFAADRTALEALLTTRLEGTAESGATLRLRLGFGAGLNAHFGAPEERALLSVEVFDRHAR